MEPHIRPKKVNWRGDPNSEVLIVTDFPTAEEEMKGLMDCEYGKLLEAALPIPISQCAIASLSQYSPDDNNFAYLIDTEALNSGLKLIKDYLSHSKTKLIILLGPQPLRYLTHNYDIYKWRGSPLLYDNRIKVIATHHPRDVLQNRTLYPIFAFDIKRGFEYKEGKERIYSDRFTVVSDPVEQLNFVPEILEAARNRFVTVDIETRKSDLSLLCVGFGLSPERAICFVCKSESTLRILQDLLPKLEKVAYHNSLFDIQVLRYVHGITLRAPYFDTMVAQHVDEPELPKGLDFLCSTITWRPCYWADISFDEDSKTWSDTAAKRDSLYIYNCLDCVVTYEAVEVFLAEGMDKNPIFQYEMEMLEVSMHMGETGFLVDNERLSMLQTAYKSRWEKDYQTLFALNDGKVINISSPKQVKWLLYDTLKLPERKDRKGKVTTDGDALVSLIAYCKDQMNSKKTDASKLDWMKKLSIVKLILQLRGYEKMMSSYLNITISPDGRVRSVWKVCGTETGRWSCALWIDDSGFNAQTLPREKVEIEINEHPSS